jgi:hypothetical protein
MTLVDLLASSPFHGLAGVGPPGKAVPGDPQHSYANILRAGFERAELRPNFAPALA